MQELEEWGFDSLSSDTYWSPLSCVSNTKESNSQCGGETDDRTVATVFEDAAYAVHMGQVSEAVELAAEVREMLKTSDTKANDAQLRLLHMIDLKHKKALFVIRNTDPDAKYGEWKKTKQHGAAAVYTRKYASNNHLDSVLYTSVIRAPLFQLVNALLDCSQLQTWLPYVEVLFLFYFSHVCSCCLSREESCCTP
jgi:hypothetical protein